jgi:TonB family protein
MRRLILQLFYLFIFLTSYSQDTLTLMLDDNYMKTEESKATIIRTAIISNNKYVIIDKSVEGRMLNYGVYESLTPFIENGLSIFYNLDGSVYSKGFFNHGKPIAKWIYYSRDRNDTVDYNSAHRFYSYLKDTCDLNIPIQFDTTSEILRKEVITYLYRQIKLPAKCRNIDTNFVVNVDLKIDTNGFIKCPKIENENLDLNYEILRVLLLFKSRYSLHQPARLVITIVFNKTDFFEEQSRLLQSENLNEKDEGHWFVDVSAIFQGGDINKFNTWVKTNVQYPIEAAEEGAQGKVVAQFSINKEGEICDIKIINSVHPALDKEVIRILKSSPKWIPAMLNNNPVKQIFVIPVAFTMN